MRWLLIATLVAAFAVMMASMAAADPNLPSVNAHRHYVQSPNGTYQAVGPNLCDNLDTAGIKKAFSQFHNNVHVASSPGAIGDAAPGLHDHRGAELVATFPCSAGPPNGQ
jgi:hypothetical protein